MILVEVGLWELDILQKIFIVPGVVLQLPFFYIILILSVVWAAYHYIKKAIDII